MKYSQQYIRTWSGLSLKELVHLYVVLIEVCMIVATIGEEEAFRNLLHFFICVTCDEDTVYTIKDFISLYT